MKQEIKYLFLICLDSGRGGSRNGSHQLHSSSSMSGRDSRESSMPETTSRSQSMSMPTPSMKYSAKRPTPAAPAPPVSTESILTETQLKNEIHSVIDGCKTCSNADAFIEVYFIYLFIFFILKKIAHSLDPPLITLGGA